jgi:hypothetical protein
MPGSQRVSLWLLMLLFTTLANAADASQAISGRLLDPDERPLTVATVCLSTRNLDAYDAHLPYTDWSAEKVATWPAGQDQIWLTTTDSDGQFSFAAVSKAYFVFAANDTGYVIARSKNLALPATLRLTRWSKIHCVVMRGDQRAGAGLPISIGYSYENWSRDEVGPFLDVEGGKSDAHGELAIEHAFAGR